MVATKSNEPPPGDDLWIAWAYDMIYQFGKDSNYVKTKVIPSLNERLGVK